jgi:hypothetical protein
MFANFLIMAKNTKKFFCKCMKTKTSIAKIMGALFKFHIERLVVMSSVIYTNDFSFSEMNCKKDTEISYWCTS